MYQRTSLAFRIPGDYLCSHFTVKLPWKYGHPNLLKGGPKRMILAIQNTMSIDYPGNPVYDLVDDHIRSLKVIKKNGKEFTSVIFENDYGLFVSKSTTTDPIDHLPQKSDPSEWARENTKVLVSSIVEKMDAIPVVNEGNKSFITRVYRPYYSYGLGRNKNIGTHSEWDVLLFDRTRFHIAIHDPIEKIADFHPHSRERE